MNRRHILGTVLAGCILLSTLGCGGDGPVAASGLRNSAVLVRNFLQRSSLGAGSGTSVPVDVFVEPVSPAQTVGTGIAYGLGQGRDISWLNTQSDVRYRIRLAGNSADLIDVQMPMTDRVPYAGFVMGDAEAPAGGNTPKFFLFPRETGPVIPGRARLRILHGLSDVAAVDLYLLKQTGPTTVYEPISTGVTYQQMTGYFETTVPPVGTTMQIIVTAAGVNPATATLLVSVDQRTTLSGNGRTVVVLTNDGASPTAAKDIRLSMEP